MINPPNPSPAHLPITGVIGIISNSASELDLAIQKGLHSVEIRADLLLEAGMPKAALLQLVARARELGLANLVTVRHQSQGGAFDGDEQQRIAICREALAAGADILDLEWGTAAGDAMLSDGHPLILSHHNFDRMLEQDELNALTEAMSAGNPAAIKIVPTVSKPGEAATMLHWVESAQPRIRRIGFGMGEAGGISRILATACGSPVTYTTFGEPVAPGQIALDELQDLYRVATLDQQTRVLALIDSSPDASSRVKTINQALATYEKNGICVPFPLHSLAELAEHAKVLRIIGCHIAYADTGAVLSILAGVAQAGEIAEGDMLVQFDQLARGKSHRFQHYSDQRMLSLFA